MTSAPVGAIYARYSSRFQKSIEDQVRTCQEWAERNGIEVPDALIFADRAVSGRSARRKGLQALQDALENDQVDVVIIFTTNRLFRKTYQSLAFVEEEIVDRGKRCVFVCSNIDTDEVNHWRQMLQIHAMNDEFVIQMAGEHVRAAHKGLLQQARVFGTITYGYTGEPIPGMTTRLGKPARQLVKDPVNSEWVQKIFYKFINERLSIRTIVRWLTAEGAPLPPRAFSRRWTRLAVRRILSNSRYRGAWCYGCTKSVWNNKKNYLFKVDRDEPLAEVHNESLRIIDDSCWFAAQQRLEEIGRNAGRKPRDGDRRSRPRVLNGLVFCPKHGPLEVGAGFGKYMKCRACYESPDPEIYSLLPRRLLLVLLCRRLAEMIRDNRELVQEVVEQCQHYVQAETQPDPGRIAKLRRDIDRLTTNITFILEVPGNTKQDLEENRRHMAQYRSERANKQRELSEIEEAARNPAQPPTISEVQLLVEDLEKTLLEAADSDDPAELAALHDIIVEITGGRIVVSQQGERKPQRGWLRASFRARLVQTLAQRTGFTDLDEKGIEVHIDIKRSSRMDEQAEQAKRLYDDGLMHKEIARQLGCNRNRVTQVLKHWCQKHEQELPDGRTRRSTLQQKQSNVPIYQAIADQVKQMWDEDQAVVEISRKLQCSDTTAWKALAHWHCVRGLSAPTAKDRRKRLMARARQLYDDDWEIKVIAAELGYTQRGMKLLLKRSFELEGREMTDGRSRRHGLRKVGCPERT